MDRRSKLGDVPELEVPKFVERNPLIDPRKLRSCRSTPASRSLCRSAYTDTRNAQRAPSKGSYSLRKISELGQSDGTPNALNRSRSVPLHFYTSQYQLTPCPNHVRSPQYRVNPIVKFSDRPFPEKMNYGIAGYNTARPRSFTSVPESTTRSRSFSTVPESATRRRSFSSIPESSKRPRSFTSVPETKSRPRSFISIPESTSALQTRAPSSVLWRSWTRRFRDKMGRVRVRETCSKLLSRFRGGHL
ncbi:hypothetical protein M758_3G052100 [Ceratodon purpureus]|uniref:Uncharacterized protein n=1 Tax=Ceratodon purpureus TaxID=3225 RepID=A0A8T0IG78_CERPU|nr:hypothetical protein KC19_3G054100 [Ceratodon purpureus]KAG0621836.1 hypothetical protein M758_3G052100 [Ceratodon purpureus]